MKSVIYFSDKNSFFSDCIENYAINIDLYYDYLIDIKMSFDDKYTDLVSDDKVAYLKKFIKRNKNKNTDTQCLPLEIVKKYSGKENELLKQAEYIRFESEDLEKINEFITNNPEIKSKKIVLDIYTIDKLTYKEITSVFKENCNCLYFFLDGNSDLVSFSDYSNTVTIISNYVTMIKSYNLSPIEQVMYVYDLVRNRVYTAEKGNESPSVSRSLTQVLLNNKIVCVGYSILFNKILEGLEINSTPCILLNKNQGGGHQRSVVYIKDDKYNIDGIYYFDPTWDSKESKDNNDFLLSYKYFCKTKKEMESLQYKNYTDTTFGKFDNNLFPPNNTKKLFDENKYFINNTFKLIEGKSIILNLNFIDNKLILKLAGLSSNLDEVLDKTQKYCNKFNKPISDDQFLKILFNVRELQHKQDPNNYQFDIQSFSTILLSSNYELNDTNLKKIIDIFDNNKIEILEKEDSNLKDQEGLAKTLKINHKSK